jgi:hypothetical protein
MMRVVWDWQAASEGGSRCSVHDKGAKPLEEVPPENGEGVAGGGDAEPAGAGGKPTGLGANSQSDVERIAAVAGGGAGSPRNNPPAAGAKGRVGPKNSHGAVRRNGR